MVTVANARRRNVFLEDTVLPAGGLIFICLHEATRTLGVVLLLMHLGKRLWSRDRPEAPTTVALGADSLTVSWAVGSGYTISPVDNYVVNSDCLLIEFQKNGERQMEKLFEADFDAASWQMLVEEVERIRA